MENWPRPLGGHLTVGIRLTTYILTDDKRSDDNTYFGQVNELDADTNIGFFRSLYADWHFAEGRGADFGVGLAWSQVQAKTRNIQGHSDGTVKTDGPVLTAIARYPIDLWVAGYRWTVAPSVGLGVSYLMADFEHVDWWHYGFGTDMRDGGTEADAQAAYNDWISRGAPPGEITYTRTISVDNATGWVFQCGARASHGPVGVDLFLRYMDFDVEGTYTRTGGGASENINITYPLSHWTMGIGVSYDF